MCSRGELTFKKGTKWKFEFIFLAAKIKAGLPAERLQRLRTLFFTTAVHFRMREGGTAILNLNLVRLHAEDFPN